MWWRKGVRAESPSAHHSVLSCPGDTLFMNGVSLSTSAQSLLIFILLYCRHALINISFQWHIWAIGKALKYWWVDEEMTERGSEREACWLYLVSQSPRDLQVGLFLSDWRGWIQLLFYFEWCYDKLLLTFISSMSEILSFLPGCFWGNFHSQQKLSFINYTGLWTRHRYLRLVSTLKSGAQIRKCKNLQELVLGWITNLSVLSKIWSKTVSGYTLFSRKQYTKGTFYF